MVWNLRPLPSSCCKMQTLRQVTIASAQELGLQSKYDDARGYERLERMNEASAIQGGAAQTLAP